MLTKKVFQKTNQFFFLFRCLHRVFSNCQLALFSSSNPEGQPLHKELQQALGSEARVLVSYANHFMAVKRSQGGFSLYVSQ